MSNGNPKNKTAKAKSKTKSVRKAQDATANVKAAHEKHETKLLESSRAMTMVKTGGPTYGLGAIDFKAWARLLANPFKAPLCKCPVNFNPVPTVSTFVATTVCTLDLPVDAGASREVIIFPGHSDEAAADPMDGEAYHSLYQRFINGDFGIGPVQVPPGYGVGVATSGNLTAATLPSANTLTGYTAVRWDNELPMTATYSAGHFRWKCIAIGVRWKNVNPELTRGGLVRSVQPSIAYVPANSPAGPGWLGYDRFKTFRQYSNLDGEISWIPRIEDLSFWHSTNVATTGSDNAGIRLLFTAPSGAENAQSYTLEVMCCWELAGSSVEPLATAAVHTSSLRNVTEDGINAMANGTSTAARALEVFGQAAAVATKVMALLPKGGA